MKNIFGFLLIFVGMQTFASYNDFFENKSLRLDYYHAGNSENEFIYIDELLEEPYWGGSKVNLVDTFEYGAYKFELIDVESNKVMYSRGYSSLFFEWRFTPEAKETSKAFSESVVMPYPRNKSKVLFYKRKKDLNWERLFEYNIDPQSYFIVQESRMEREVFDVHKSGDPAKKVDIVIIPDGYTKNEMEKFKEDCKRLANYLFGCKPFDINKQNFNIYGVIAESEESGPDLPGKDVWKNTVVNSSFYTFDSERYLMTIDNKSIRNLAANAPYDQIYILVNTDKYGGGGILNFYSTCSSDNEHSGFVFTHEFGHSFVGLGDEYVGGTSLEGFYTLEKEPYEPNLTTMVDFSSKWKHLVDENVPIPTPDDEKYYDKVGAFEGGGYISKGIYRPVHNCSMNTICYDNFCPVCKEAIQKMIDFYCE